MLNYYFIINSNKFDYFLFVDFARLYLPLLIWIWQMIIVRNLYILAELYLGLWLQKEVAFTLILVG